MLVLSPLLNTLDILSSKWLAYVSFAHALDCFAWIFSGSGWPPLAETRMGTGKQARHRDIFMADCS